MGRVARFKHNGSGWTTRGIKWTIQEWTRLQGRPKQDGGQHRPPPGFCVAKNSQRPASVETVHGAIETLMMVVNLVMMNMMIVHDFKLILSNLLLLFK